MIFIYLSVVQTCLLSNSLESSYTYVLATLYRVDMSHPDGTVSKWDNFNNLLFGAPIYIPCLIIEF